MTSLSQQIYNDGHSAGRAEGRVEGRKEGHSNALQLVRLYVGGNSILQVAEAVGEDETAVRKSLVEAGLLQD